MNSLMQKRCMNSWRTVASVQDGQQRQVPLQACHAHAGVLGQALNGSRPSFEAACKSLWSRSGVDELTADS